jgi:hypothetical protein
MTGHGLPPAEGCEENQPEQRGRGEGGAEDRFGGVCQHQLVVQRCADAPFAPARQADTSGVGVTVHVTG